MQPKTIAQFLFEDKFNLTGRGLVIMGQIVSGELSSGNSIYLVQNGDYKAIKITAIDFGHGPTRYHFVGLHVDEDTIPLPDFDELKGTIVNIIDQ